VSLNEYKRTGIMYHTAADILVRNNDGVGCGYASLRASEAMALTRSSKRFESGRTRFR